MCVNILISYGVRAIRHFHALGVKPLDALIRDLDEKVFFPLSGKNLISLRVRET